MKKLNRYLLLHYPQIWNLRLLWVLPAIAILHALFYAAGYASFSVGRQLHDRYALGEHVLGESMGFSILVTALLIIVWLVFYLRNNPFKSFYPLSRWYFVIEFSFIMFVFAGSMTFFNSYANGYWQSIRTKTAHVNLEAETNTLNIAYGLIPKDRGHYRLHACCDSLAFIDSLREARNSRWSEIHKKDSANHLAWDYENNKALPDYRDTILADIDSAISQYVERAGDRDYNYMHFCHRFYCQSDTLPAIITAHDIAGRIQLMLTKHDKAAVGAVLDSFQRMCVTYEIQRDVQPVSYKDKVFKYADFHIDEFLSRYTNYDDDDGNFNRPESLNFSFDDVSSSLGKIYQARAIRFDPNFWIAVLYISFGLALLLYSYRLSARKPWFIALVGSGVLAILLSLSAIFVHSSAGFCVLLLLLLAAFYILHLAFRSAVRRTLSGVNLVWLTWMLPFQCMIVLELIKSLLPLDIKTYKYPPLYYQIQEHYLHIHFVYLIVAYFYTLTLLSMLYRRWQAMPEE